jgi:hypothetical protein
MKLEISVTWPSILGYAQIGCLVKNNPLHTLPPRPPSYLSCTLFVSLSTPSSLQQSPSVTFVRHYHPFSFLPSNIR